MKRISAKGIGVVRISALVAAMMLGSFASASAQVTATDPASTDRAAIHSVIRNQLLAFRADDADLAYSLASPVMQRHFLSPELFLEMIKLAYPAVYRPRALYFDSLEVANDHATQKVVLLGEGEFALMAIYSLQKQGDGRWLISACDLYASGSRVI